MVACFHVGFTIPGQTFAEMFALGTFQLTHPELLSENELRDVLKNSCIDFSNFEKLSKSELIETYKRVAMPLPQRQKENSECLSPSTTEENKSTDSLNSNACHLKRNHTDTKRDFEESNAKAIKSSHNEQKHLSKRICLSNSKNEAECNGLDKRTNDERHDESPSKKRQKITWP